MKRELEKTFDPAAIEARWYSHWEEKGLFRPHRPAAEPFTIVNPPPNVTGSLHIGHALDNTLQDVVIRYERLRGKDALWVVGTDHAGIATQMVVERQLEAAGDKRTNYTREDFIAKVWEWKHESGGTITRQLRRLGCSMDWSREQFTMDPHFTRAVVKVFVDLYNEGLIYRDKRLVNWDPKLKTAISDLEVETREVKGHFWRFRYPFADGSSHVEVATTRPETMLADMAVAVHPEDERYKGAVGKDIRQPITGRLFKVVADEHADPELGSGVVKITPGHDFNDFEVGKRAGMKPGEMLNMFDAEARVVQTADGLVPAEFIGLDRFEARKLVVERMKDAGFLIPWTDKDGNEHDAEPRVIQQPYGDRGGVPIEPWLTDQWYVNAAELAKAPMQAVRDGRIEIVPKTWEKTFFNWMENIQPWCVSRQLWWGHRIPAWYGPTIEDGRWSYSNLSERENEAIVAQTEDRALQIASERSGTTAKVYPSKGEALGAHFAAVGENRPLGHYPIWRDEDVLDTWFSSALWPFATLGWPEEPTPNPSRLREGSETCRTEGEASRSGVGDAATPVRAEPVEAPSFSSPPAHAAEGKSGPSTSSGRAESGVGPIGAEDANLLARHYPNDLLISGFDILFFWDARMAMQGMKLMGDVPWRRLYLHGLVRAADGQKMSKSKGNVVDPLGLIDRYGADALRFFMAAMESQGRDVKMDERRVEGYRNFATKLWNAARFCQANGIGASETLAAPVATSAVNRWIVGEVVETLAELDKAMADLRFDAAANAIYHFVWDSFCDWYIELIKPALSNAEGPVLSPLPLAGGAGGGPVEADAKPDDLPTPNPSRKREGNDADETRKVAGWVLDQILVMLHPFMPFVTEELWSSMGARADYPLITAKWPEPAASVDPQAKREVEWLIALVGNLRAAKNELGIAPGARLEAFLPDRSAETRGIIERNGPAIERLARLNGIRFEPAPAGAAMQVGAGDANIVVPLGGVIDIAAEKTRLAKALEASQKEARSLEGRLSNAAFVEKAKPEAVDKARADHAHHAAEAERLAAALARLG